MISPCFARLPARVITIYCTRALESSRVLSASATMALASTRARSLNCVGEVDMLADVRLNDISELAPLPAASARDRTQLHQVRRSRGDGVGRRQIGLRELLI